MDPIKRPDIYQLTGDIERIYIQGVILNKTKLEFHTFLQNEIVELATKFSLHPQKEFLTPNLWGNINGYIDVVWTLQQSIPIVAIEIDSSLKAKSIEKLIASKAQLLFWIYYGTKPYKSFVQLFDPDRHIHVVHYSTIFEKLEKNYKFTAN